MASAKGSAGRRGDSPLPQTPMSSSVLVSEAALFHSAKSRASPQRSSRYNSPSKTSAFDASSSVDIVGVSSVIPPTTNQPPPSPTHTLDSAFQPSSTRENTNVSSSVISSSANQPNVVNLSSLVLQDATNQTQMINSNEEFPPLVAANSSPVKINYASIIKEAKASIKCLEKFQVSYSEIEGSKVASIPASVFRSPPLWDDILIGKFPQGQVPHVAKVHVIVNKIWTQGNKNIRIDAYPVNDSTIKFRIRDNATRLRVLKRGLWTIADVPMFLYKWTPAATDSQPSMQAIPLWITLKNVPQSLFSWEGISLIASSIGEPKKLHQETEMCVRFEEAKVLIETDLTKELPQHLLVQDSDGSIKKIYIQYPKLPQFCFTCRHWGHTLLQCSANTQVEVAPNVEAPVSSQQNEVLPTAAEFTASLEGTSAVLPLETATNTQQSTLDKQLINLENSTSVPISTSHVNNKLSVGKVSCDTAPSSYGSTHANHVSTHINAATCVEAPAENTEINLQSNEQHSPKLISETTNNASPSNKEWKSVSPGKRSRSPKLKQRDDQIAVSTTFNVLIESTHEDEDNEQAGQLVATEIISEPEQKQRVGSTEIGSSRRGRSRKPPLKYQQQQVLPQSSKTIQSKRSSQHKR